MSLCSLALGVGVDLGLHSRPFHEVIDDDAEIGSLRADDRIEFAPIVRESDGRSRTSWVTSDASPDEFGPAEGVFCGPMPGGLLLHVLPPAERI